MEYLRSIYMNDYHFTDGNLIVLYGIHNNQKSLDNLPQYITERINLCYNTYQVILKSKPDANRTMILVFAENLSSELIVNELIDKGIDRKIIATDSNSKTIYQCFDQINELLKNKLNPPYVYFIGSVWLKDIYDSIILSKKFKKYQMKFEGALDYRSVNEVEQEKSLYHVKKNNEYYKNTIKNKAVDMLLNYIFPEKK